MKKNEEDDPNQSKTEERRGSQSNFQNMKT